MKLLLAELTTTETAALLQSPRSCVLLPVGSVEPHGPHLPLGTDTVISEVVARRAAEQLVTAGVAAVVAPTLPYGVTEFARGFSGAIGISPLVLTSVLAEIATAYLRDGFSHVCFVNNHLEPAHDAAIRAAAASHPKGAVSVACPLTRRWARTLSDEFRRGNCHAGRYETSLVMAADAVVVGHDQLEGVSISLSDGISAGKTSFIEMGMTAAYTGTPHEASIAEGESLYERLVTMTVTEVLEGMDQRNIAQ